MATFVRSLQAGRRTTHYLLRNYTYSQLRTFGSSSILPSKAETQDKSDSAQEPVESQQVVLSDSCVKQLHKVGSAEKHLRVAVEGGGCSGFQYIFELSTEVNEDDRVFEKDGARVVIDVDSLEFLAGATIDYHEELIRSAFIVQQNPKAEQGCSCGASFALKI